MDPLTWQAYLAYNKEIGRIFGQPVNISRPPLGTTVDQSPTLVHSAKQFKVEKSGPQLSQPTLYNMENYALFGDFELLTPGDVITPTDSTNSTPVVTYLSGSQGEGYRAFRTSRTCNIVNGYDQITETPNNIYTNVRFEFLSTGYVRGSFDGLVLGAGSDPILEVVLFSLNNLQPHNVTNDILGMQLVDTTGSQEVVWVIKMVEEIYPLMRLVVEQDR